MTEHRKSFTKTEGITSGNKSCLGWNGEKQVKA